jgi:hypothetical protein
MELADSCVHGVHIQCITNAVLDAGACVSHKLLELRLSRRMREKQLVMSFNACDHHDLGLQLQGLLCRIELPKEAPGDTGSVRAATARH